MMRRRRDVSSAACTVIICMVLMLVAAPRPCEASSMLKKVWKSLGGTSHHHHHHHHHSARAGMESAVTVTPSSKSAAAGGSISEDEDISRATGATVFETFAPLPIPFNKYLGSLKLEMNATTVDSGDLTIDIGPIECGQASFGGTSIIPDPNTTSVTTAINGLGISCTAPFAAHYKFLNPKGSLTLSTADAHVTTRVAPTTKDGTPAKQGVIPTRANMFSCALDAGNVHLDIEGGGPTILILKAFEGLIKKKLVEHSEQQACTMIENVVNRNKNATSFLDSLFSFLQSVPNLLLDTPPPSTDEDGEAH